MTLAQLRLILGALVALSATVMSCAKRQAADETTPAFTRHLGESTASPGDNPSKPAPVTPDDPQRMNVSMGISNLPNPEIAPPVTTPRTDSPNATANPNTSTAAPNANPPATPDPATSSTTVAPPADITPPSTTSQDPGRPGVFSPPPPSDSPSPTPQPAPTPPPGDTPAQ